MATMADSKARRTRRSFTDAYKTGAVRLVLDEGKTVAAAARDLGLTESSLRNWVEQARADRTKGKTGLTTEERTELAALRKDNRELRMERDILKKAAAIAFQDGVTVVVSRNQASRLLSRNRFVRSRIESFRPPRRRGRLAWSQPDLAFWVHTPGRHSREARRPGGVRAVIGARGV